MPSCPEPPGLLICRLWTLQPEAPDTVFYCTVLYCQPPTTLQLLNRKHIELLCADVISSLLPVCKEEVKEEPEEPPHIKEEQEDLHDRAGDAYGILITNVCSYAPSGKNFITTDVKTLMTLTCII